MKLLNKVLIVTVACLATNAVLDGAPHVRTAAWQGIMVVLVSLFVLLAYRGVPGLWLSAGGALANLADSYPDHTVINPLFFAAGEHYVVLNLADLAIIAGVVVCIPWAARGVQKWHQQSSSQRDLQS